MNTTTNTTYVRLHNTTDQTTCKLKLTVGELFDLRNWKSWGLLYLKQVTAQQNNENQIKMWEMKKKSFNTYIAKFVRFQTLSWGHVDVRWNNSVTGTEKRQTGSLKLD